MKFLVSLFWGFIFSFIAIFIISSLLGSNGISSGISVQNCIVLSVFFTFGVATLELVIGKNKK